MGTYADAVERAIVFSAAVVFAVGNSAFDTVICFTVIHLEHSILDLIRPAG